MKPATLFLLLIATGAFGQNCVGTVGCVSNPFNQSSTITINGPLAQCWQKTTTEVWNGSAWVVASTKCDIPENATVLVSPTLESLSAEIADLKARVAELNRLQIVMMYACPSGSHHPPNYDYACELDGCALTNSCYAPRTPMQQDSGYDQAKKAAEAYEKNAGDVLLNCHYVSTPPSGEEYWAVWHFVAGSETGPAAIAECKEKRPPPKE